jgi:hypothetical protein
MLPFTICWLNQHLLPIQRYGALFDSIKVETGYHTIILVLSRVF